MWDFVVFLLIDLKKKEFINGKNKEMKKIIIQICLIVFTFTIAMAQLNDSTARVFSPPY
jgi:hypothetical protein